MPLLSINIGCGSSPTEGWSKFDGSPSVKLSRQPIKTSVLKTVGMLNKRNLEFINFIKSSNIEYADATGRFPLADSSCDVVYSSHMLEHINPLDVASFLSEAKRVLSPDGIIRLAVPDLRRKAEEYLKTGDADEFMRSTMVSEFWAKTTSLKKRVRFAFAGDPSAYKWMYDGESLVRLLEQHGFRDCRVTPDGVTSIENPGKLNLAARSPESVFVEGRFRA